MTTIYLDDERLRASSPRSLRGVTWLSLEVAARATADYDGMRLDARTAVSLAEHVDSMHAVITSRDNEKLKLVRKLHERRWRDKLGLFFVEGEDLVEAATAEPVELLVAGENVEAELLAEVSTAAHPPRVIGVYRRDDLPAAAQRPVTLDAVAAWPIPATSGR